MKTVWRRQKILLFRKQTEMFKRMRRRRMKHHPRRRKQISRKKLKIQRRMIRTAPRTQELRKKQTRAMGLRMSLRGRKWKLRETQRPELCRLRRKQKAHL